MPPELRGTPEDPTLFRRLFAFGRPYVPLLCMALLLSVVAAVAKVGYFFLIEGVLGPMFETGGPRDVALELHDLLVRLALPPDALFPDLRTFLVLLGQGISWAWTQSAPLVQLRWAAISVVILVAFEQGNKYAQKLLMRWVALNVVRSIRIALFQKLMTLSMRFFHVNHSAKLLSRITNDLSKLGSLLVDVGVNVLTDVFTVIASLWYVWHKGGMVVIVSLVVAGITFIPLQQISRRVRSRELKNQKKMSRVFVTLAEALSAQKVVKAFGGEPHETARFKVANDRFTEGRMRSTQLQARTVPLIELLGAIGVAAFLYLGGRSVIEGTWEGPAFFAVILALFHTVASLRRLGDTTTKFQAGLSSADRVATLLYTEPDIVDAPDAIELDGFRNSIRFDHVWYAHDSDTDVLKDVDFELRKGQTLAIVGHTGSGKTTIGDLVPRFYDVDRGAVLIDGHDVRRVTMASLRRQIAMVTQETQLFEGTIASNIAYAMPDATRVDIVRAAQAAFAHDFIERLPGGYDAPVGEHGATLSGGERQRIAIARALLRDAPILILDEATSALDSKSERIVQEAIDHLKEGRTTIVIAHRLSTVRDADLILVLDGGRLVERGNHGELMARDEAYASMIRLQTHG